MMVDIKVGARQRWRERTPERRKDRRGVVLDSADDPPLERASQGLVTGELRLERQADAASDPAMRLARQDELAISSSSKELAEVALHDATDN